MKFEHFPLLSVKRISRVFAGVLFFANLATVAGANQVLLFFAPGYGTTSGGEPIPTEGFTFEMGSFVDGFEPTYENRAAWHEYWITEDPESGVEVGLVNAFNSWWSEAPLYPEYESFGAVGFNTLVRPDGGVSEGDRIYIWGYNSKDLSGIAEWILVTNPDWKFPAPIPWGELFLPDYFPTTIEAGTIAIVGSINHPDYPEDPFERQLQTDSVGAEQGFLSGGESQSESETFFTVDSGTSTTSSDSDSGGDVGTMDVGSGHAFPFASCTELAPLPIPTSYADWIDPYAVDLGGETGYEETPMHDGVPNITKYALGLDPTVGGRLCLPRPVFREHESETHLAVRFTQPDWITGVMHTLESSPDLAVWTQHHDAVTVTEEIADSPYEKAWILDPEPSEPLSRRFLRLRTEEDNGIYTTAKCVPDEGVIVTVDATKWIDDNQLAPDQLGSMQIERAKSPDGTFAPLFSVGHDHGWSQFPDLTAEPGKAYYYRASLSYSPDGTSTENSPLSNVALVYTNCAPVLAPGLTASCRTDRIVLKWLAPSWAREDYRVMIEGWTLMGATDPEGPYDPVFSWEFGESPGGIYLDTTVSPETTHYYYIHFVFSYDGGSSIQSEDSAIVSASTCDSPQIGPIDIAFIVDNTKSGVKDAVTELKKDSIIDTILTEIAAASGGDYRLALVTPDADIVNVRLNFEPQNAGVFKQTLQDLPTIGGGNGHPETEHGRPRLVELRLHGSQQGPGADQESGRASGRFSAGVRPPAQREGRFKSCRAPYRCPAGRIP